MSAQETRKQKPIPVTFRLDPDSALTVQKLAEKKGLTRSDFIRAVVEKVLAPIQDEDASTAAAIAALPPSARRKAQRAIEIQKRLRELRASSPKAHALSSLFQDGDGAAHDAETVRLEDELAALGKAFEAEVAPSAAAPKTKKNDSGPEVCAVGTADDERVAECPMCGEDTAIPDVEAGEVVDFRCSECDGELKSNGSDVWPAADGDEPLAEGEEDGSGEDEPEESVVEKDGDRLADRYKDIMGLLNSLRPCRDELSLLDYGLARVFGGLPICWLLHEELERVSKDVAGLDDDWFGQLREMAQRVVRLKKKISGLKTSGADDGNEASKKYSAELGSMAAEFRAAADRMNGADKKSAPSGWL